MEARIIYEVLFYEDAEGRCPAEVFIDSMPVKAKAKAARWIRKLEEYGPDLPRPYADVVRGKIRELRVLFASMQYRFLYFFYGRHIIITHGFIKKTYEVPESEIIRANNMMLDFRARVEKEEMES